MSEYDIELPDGQKYKISYTRDLTDDELKGIVGSYMSGTPLPADYLSPKTESQPKGMGDLRKFESKLDSHSLVRKFEGYRETPYWDVNAHRAGYGSDTYTTADGKVHKVTPQSRVSREDAERDLQRRVGDFQHGVVRSIGAPAWGSLSEEQKASLTSIAYNYGSLPKTVVSAVRNGGDVEKAIRALGSHNKGVNRKRRNEEADIFKSGSVAGAMAGQALPQSKASKPKPKDLARNLVGAMFSEKSVKTEIRAGTPDDPKPVSDVELQADLLQAKNPKLPRHEAMIHAARSLKGTGAGAVEGANQAQQMLTSAIAPVMGPVGEALGFVEGMMPSLTNLGSRLAGTTPQKLGKEMAPQLAAGLVTTPLNAVAELMQLADDKADPETKARAAGNLIAAGVLSELPMGGSISIAQKAAQSLLAKMGKTKQGMAAIQKAKASFTPKADPNYPEGPTTLKDAGIKVKTKAKAAQSPVQASTKEPPVESPPKVETSSTDPTGAGMGKSTGISHAKVKEIRDELGLVPYEKTRKPDAVLFEEARKLEGQEEALTSKVLDKGERLKDNESMALGFKLDDLRTKMRTAKESSDFDAYDAHNTQASRIMDALDPEGSEAGRALRVRRFLFKEQSDPWYVAHKLKKAGVSEKKIAAVIEQLEETKGKLATSEEEVANLNKQLLKMEAETIIRTTSKQGARRGNIEAIKKENSDLWAALTKSSAKVSAGVDIETAKIFAKLVTNSVKLGAATVDDAIRTVIEEAASRGFTVTTDDIYAGQRENLAGRAVSRTEAQKKVAKLQAELNKAAKEATPGTAVPTKEAKRLDDVRTQIAELERQIKEGDFASGKSVKVKSRLLELKEAELKQLRAEVRGIIKAAEPRSAMGKVNELARESQLANPVARIVDITANTAKMASYAATNPFRSILSSIITPKTVGRERLLFTPTKFKAVFDNAPARWKAELKGVLKGADFETIEKYGHPSGWFSRLAGASDVVFKDVYARLAYDDYALGAGKALGLKGKELAAYRAKSFKQLVRESAEGPLTEEDVLIARATAQDWAARQTFNVENMASKTISSIKGGVGSALDKEFGKNAGDSFRLAVDTFTRFSKVIGNVALERLNYSGAGIGEAVVRGVVSKSKNAGKMPVKDARLISDLAVKGLSGLATIEAGKQAYGWLKDQDWIKGEIVTTSGGTKFVKWTLLPDVAGGLDADQLGGLASPMLYGATQQMIEDSKLTEKQKAQLWLSYSMGQKFNQPLLSGMGSLTDIFDAKGKAPEQVGANLAARALIPSGVNEIGTRMDKARTGIELRKASTPLEEFIKRLPVYRESLKPNEKKP
jgi:GH24 family phage-related lysozyme (muramidase)